MIWDLLDATCEEIARNGFKKILIVNGHGGNPNFLRFFVQSQLERRRDCVVHFYDPAPDPAWTQRLDKLRQSDAAGDQHAGERETLKLLYLHPELVQMDRAAAEWGANRKRLTVPDVYTAIWWYADYPNHYAGEGAKGSREFGEVYTEGRLESLRKTLRAVKADTQAPALQKEFFDRVKP